jgi:hypothetical protein
MEQLMGEKKEKKTRYTNGTTQERIIIGDLSDCRRALLAR